MSESFTYFGVSFLRNKASKVRFYRHINMFLNDLNVDTNTSTEMESELLYIGRRSKDHLADLKE